MLEKLTGKRILITGANGFVGNHLLHHLTNAGIFITAIDRQLPQKLKREGNVHWISIDATKVEEIETVIRTSKPNIVINLAAILGGDRSIEFTQQAVNINFIGLHNLLASLGKNDFGLERIVTIGTGEEYGNSEVLPITEDQSTNPVSPYSASKAIATQFARLYNRLFGLPVVILRPFIVYGPGQSPTMMIPELITSLLKGMDFKMTEGKQTRDFIFVNDVVDGIIAAAVKKGIDGEVFNICSSEERSIREVAELILDIMASKNRLLFGAKAYRENEVWRLFGSYEKARRLLNWSPKTNIKDGLRKTINWYRDNIGYN